ncbi:tyrosine-type recombinase/integrase [Aquibacillus salsiterrae]|uniref:Tyrosine-type recombinase/integrase n=1 Tax=Aquibacillus salsiterrae TaxID=2950439 RepID=A0A9X4AHR8_9BACI|nr:tyrosine-type recombinase/integrase [Aquibacillus salsiterrae]MDC3418508.1 tyrosine-type recombinase/integrase [Aquibacillus salsiterrae]
MELLDKFEMWGRGKDKSENTLKTYVGSLKSFDEWLLKERNQSLGNVKREGVQAYMDYLDHDKQRSASTIDKIFAAIRVYAQFADKPEIIQNINRKERDKNIYQTTPRSLTEVEKKELISKVKRDGNSRNIAIMYTLLFTGIRISELCNLKLSNIEINGAKGVLTVPESNGNGEGRVIPLTKDTVYHLVRYIESLNKDEGVLFSSRNDAPLTPRTVQLMLRSYDVSPNILRHTFCQDLINNGMDLSIVAQLAGHQDLNMTKRYMQSS